MKKTLKSTILIISISFFINCGKPKNDLEVFVSNIITSLQEHDLEKFKENAVQYETFKEIKKDITVEEYNSKISDMFFEIQSDFNREKINIQDYEVFEVREPYREYTHDGLTLIRFITILKNEKGEYLKLEFSDCLKTEDGIFFGDNLIIRN